MLSLKGIGLFILQFERQATSIYAKVRRKSKRELGALSLQRGSKTRCKIIAALNKIFCLFVENLVYIFKDLKRWKSNVNNSWLKY